MTYYENMKKALQESGDMEIGSFAADNIAAVAAEMERIRAMEIDRIPMRIFPTLASGEDLTLAAANFGVERKEATAAMVDLLIEGEAGTEITSEVCACCGEIVFRIQEEGIIPEEGSIILPAKAEETGKMGNIAAESITEFAASYAGLETVTNPLAAFGGADRENDEELRLRVIQRWQNPGTGGSKGDYLSWALSIPGVMRARVFNPSAGNVSVYIIGEGDMDMLAEETAAFIEERRPIGAKVSVQPAEKVIINVSAKVQLKDGFAQENIRQEIIRRLDAFFAEQAFLTDTVSYTRIAEQLFAEGVADVVSYTLNGAAASLPLLENQYAALGTVEIGV